MDTSCVLNAYEIDIRNDKKKIILNFVERQIIISQSYQNNFNDLAMVSAHLFCIPWISVAYGKKRIFQFYPENKKKKQNKTSKVRPEPQQILDRSILCL